MDKQRISQSVIVKIAAAVETVFAINGKRGTVDTTQLFKGKRTEHNVAARFFFFRTMHDIYGYSYTDLSHLSGIGTRNIMRAVGKIRELMFSDTLYAAVKQEIDNSITQGLL